MDDKLYKLLKAKYKLLLEENSNQYVQFVKSILPNILELVNSYLDETKEKYILTKPRNKQMVLRKKMEKIHIQEIGMYGSSITKNYGKTHSDAPGDIDIYAKLNSPLFFQRQEWWKSKQYKTIKDMGESGVIHTPIDLTIEGRNFDKDWFNLTPENSVIVYNQK
jgi:hypothetical protein